MKQYIVELTSEERFQLQQIVAKGHTAGYRMKYAHILLKADQSKDGPAGLIQRLPRRLGAICRRSIGFASGWLKTALMPYCSTAMPANISSVNWMARPKPV